MSPRILQINFRFDVPAAELSQAFAPLAQPIADTAGLRWKIWLMNEEEHESGGIYLFDDEASAQAYLAGPIVAGLGQHPALSQITAKTFGVAEEGTRVTRGPIGEAALA
jgi:hypothetical protein